MDLRLLYAAILSFLPISEVRGGIPLAVAYAIDNHIPIALVASAMILCNVLVIFVVFYFLDNIHHLLMNLSVYRRVFGAVLRRFQKKIKKFEEKYETLDFLALVIFVAIPLPGTGAWAGCLIAWFLNLDRKKSILAIALGTIIAGILVLLATLGIFSLF